GEEAATLSELTKKLNLEERIIFLGRVDDMHEFAAFYKHALALVLPSISSNENFGMVQLEAMFYSRPIITTNLKSGVPAVAEKNVSAFIVEPSDPKALAQAINVLAKDLARADQMGKAARELYEKKYQLKDATKAHKVLYEGLL